jgi:CubicO group peptidase (beta-lactamase class C family)
MSINPVLVDPEEIGLSSHRLKRIGVLMQRHVERQVCAGAVTLIARHGRVAHCQSHGFLDAESRTAMRSDALFRIYSMTKPVTTVALMMLYEEGAFRLTDPVSRFIPEFAGTRVCIGQTPDGLDTVACQRTMTIRDLLTHTAGLSYGFDEASPVDTLYRELFASMHLMSGTTQLFNPEARPLSAVIPALAALPLRYQPGERWFYSLSIDVAGYLVELLSGDTLDSFMQRRIFDPLRMADTGFSLDGGRRERLCTMYTPRQDGGLLAIDRAETSPLFAQQHFLSGGGGLVSTVQDYLRFAQMLLGKGELDGERLLGRKTVEWMLRNHLSDAVLRDSYAGSHRGLGFGLGGQVVLDAAQTGSLWSDGCFGWGGAARTDFWIDPQEDLVGLFMVQLFGGDTPWLSDDFRTLVYQALVD